MKELRHQILAVIWDYSEVGIWLPFAVITKSLPSKSMKNISVQLSYLIEKGYVETKDKQGSYRYMLTTKGIRHLKYLNAKKRRNQAVLEADMELELAKTQSFM